MRRANIMLIGEAHHSVAEFYKLFLEEIAATDLLDDQKTEKASSLAEKLEEVKTLSSDKKEKIIKRFKPDKLLKEGLEYKGKPIPKDKLKFFREIDPGIVEACEYLGCEIDGLENKITYLSLPLAVIFSRFPGMREYVIDKRNEVFAKNILKEVEKGTERVCAVVGYAHLTGYWDINGKFYSFSKLQDVIEKMNNESYEFELKTYVRIPLEGRELEFLRRYANDFLKSCLKELIKSYGSNVTENVKYRIKSLSNYTTFSRK